MKRFNPRSLDAHSDSTSCQHYLLALAVALERRAGHFLAAPTTVDIRSIEKVDPAVDRAVDDRV
jgi:hypothetical protein